MLKGDKSLIIIVACIILIGFVFLGLSNRFYIDALTGLKVDRLTGKTYQLIENEWIIIKNKTNKLEQVKVTTEKKLDNFIILDKSIIDCKFIYSREQREAGLDASIRIKNKSDVYELVYAEIRINLLKDEKTFLTRDVIMDSRIKPYETTIEVFFIDERHPDLPYTYSIQVLKVVGILIE